MKEELINSVEKEIRNICELEEELLKNGENEDKVLDVCNSAKSLFRNFLNNSEKE